MNSGSNSIPSARRRPAVILIVIAVALVAAGVLFCLRPRPVPLQVPRSALTLRDGRLYLTNSSTPFSGVMYETYPSGQTMSMNAVQDGLLNGLSQGFYTNGQLQVVEQFRNGKAEGRRTKYYPGGAKMSEVTIRDGRIAGVFRRWYENGALAEEVEMNDGVPDGNSVAYYQSGYIKAEARHERGKLVHQKFWNEGEGRKISANPKNAG